MARRYPDKRTWTQRGGRKSYGKNALSATFVLGGFEEYFKKIEALGKNLNASCKKAVDAAVPIIRETMVEGAARHRDTGDVVNAIETRKAKPDGDLIFAAIGIDLNKHPEAFEAVFQEYGDGHSFGQKDESKKFPDPFIRTAVDNNRKEIKAIIRKTLKKEGII